MQKKKKPKKARNNAKQLLWKAKRKEKDFIEKSECSFCRREKGKAVKKVERREKQELI